jgi:hypothetical protein
MNRKEVMEAALDLICGDRQKTYGGNENFHRIAERWEQQIGDEIDPWKVALLMTELKLARLANGYHEDSVIDAIGYLALLAELYEEHSNFG